MEGCQIHVHLRHAREPCFIPINMSPYGTRIVGGFHRKRVSGNKLYDVRGREIAVVRINISGANNPPENRASYPD